MIMVLMMIIRTIRKTTQINKGGFEHQLKSSKNYFLKIKLGNYVRM